MIIFQKNYEGFESLADWDRDMSEALQAEYNPAVADIPAEFQGTVHVLVTYTPHEKD